MKKFSFWKSKTFWNIIRINAAIVGGLFLLLALSSHVVLSEMSERHLESLSQKKISKIDSQMTSLLFELKQMASNIQKNAEITGKDTNQLNNYVKTITSFSQYINGGTIVNRNGDVIGYYPEDLRTVDNLKDRDYVQRAFDSKMPHFSNVITTSNRNIIVMAIPIRGKQNVEYVVNLSIHLKNNSLFHSIFEDLEMAVGGFSYVSDQNGRVLFHPNKEKVGTDMSSSPILKTVMENKSNYQKIANDEGNDFYVSYGHIAGVGWNIVALTPVESTFLAAKEFRDVLLPIFLLFAAVLFAVITFMMQRNLRSYEKLSRAFEELSRDQPVSSIDEVDEGTEIGKVIAKFNIMARELKQSKEEVLDKRKELTQQRNFMKLVIAHNPNVIYAMNWEGEYRIANKSFSQLYGLTPNDIIGKKDTEFSSKNATAKKYLKINREIISSGEEREMEDYFIDIHGKKQWFHIGKVPITHDGESLVLTVATNISDRKEKEEAMAHQAHHDQLTGLPNRKSFQRSLEKEMETSKRDNTAFALLFLDLDGFKEVNDTFGHDAGDALLMMVSSRLESCLSGQGKGFRLGGDEFTAILPDITSGEVVSEIAQQILTAVSKPYKIKGKNLAVSVSIGISLFPGMDHDADSLMKQADSAMYEAKEQGKNTFCFYNSDMGEKVAMLGSETIE